MGAVSTGPIAIRVLAAGRHALAASAAFPAKGRKFNVLSAIAGNVHRPRPQGTGMDKSLTFGY
jgi:hypothetical protein